MGRRVGQLLGAFAAFALIVASPATASVLHIIGGAPATSGAWPSAAFIQDTTGNAISSCSGTIIAPDVVMTAAHCVTNENTGQIEPVNGFRVYTGSSDWTTAPWSSAVANINVYPDFRELEAGSTDYDIAVLELATPTKAPAMPLATTADTSLYTAGENVTQVGWGVTSTDPEAAENDSLQQASAVLQSTSTCASEDLLGLGDVFDSGDQLCTLPPSTANQTVCYGDSGGPLLADNNGAWTEIGLAIYTSGCDPSDPDYYTSVAAFSHWLANQIKEMPPPAEYGTYRGTTSQGSKVTLKLSEAGKITDFNFGFTMRCARGRRSYNYQPLGDGYSWSLNANYGVGFAHTLTDSTRTHYTFTGLFTSTGKVSGTLSASWHSPHYGYCKTGMVRWSAH